MVPHVREGVRDQVFQTHVIPCHDQILEIDGAVKGSVVVLHKQRRDIVILLRLCDQGTHRLLDGEALADLDEVCGHLAADLVLLIGTDQLDILLGLLVDQLDQLPPGRLVDLLEHIHGVVGIHVLDDIRGALELQFPKVSAWIIEIGKDLGDALIAERVVEDLALIAAQLVKRV